MQTYTHLGMGTETRYLIGLGAKLWKTGVSISSDVNGSVIGTGEIMKTHIHLLLLYIYTHYLANSIPPESPAVFICNNIQTLVYDAFLLFAIQIALTWMSSARATWKPCLWQKRELTIKTCLHFRPVAVILNWIYLMFFLASKDYSRVSSNTTSFSSQRCAFVPPWPKLTQNQINRLSIVVKCRLYSY